jgi:hypothetical protein
MPFLETQLMEIKLAADKLLLDLQFAVSALGVGVGWRTS